MGAELSKTRVKRTVVRPDIYSPHRTRYYIKTGEIVKQRGRRTGCYIETPGTHVATRPKRLEDTKEVDLGADLIML